MAQHRTKKDKMNAQIHRVENSKLYSLTEIDSSQTKTTLPASAIKKIEKKPSVASINMSYVKTDLTRTAVSLGIVLVLLSAGFFFLR